MGRSNVIIVGSVVLAPLLLGLESYLLFKAHHRRARTAEITGWVEANPPTVPSTPVAQSRAAPVPAAPPPPPPANPAAPTADEARAATETVSDVPADPTVERRRQLMLQRRGEVLQAADEQVFGLLHLPDEQRAAIRAVDSAYARTVQAIGQLAPGAESSQLRAWTPTRASAPRGHPRSPRSQRQPSLHLRRTKSRASGAKPVPHGTGPRPLEHFRPVTFR